MLKYHFYYPPRISVCPCSILRRCILSYSTLILLYFTLLYHLLYLLFHTTLLYPTSLCFTLPHRVFVCSLHPFVLLTGELYYLQSLSPPKTHLSCADLDIYSPLLRHFTSLYCLKNKTKARKFYKDKDSSGEHWGSLHCLAAYIQDSLHSQDQTTQTLTQ